jgi:hypothetical protein
MPLVVMAKDEPEAGHAANETADAPGGYSIFAIAAGGISGAVIGFLFAGAFSASAAALAGVIAGLLMGWQAARLTEPNR